MVKKKNFSIDFKETLVSITLVSISKEVFSIGNIVNIEHFSNLIEYFSNLIKLFRLSAWVLRLVTNTRIYNLRSGPHITRFSPVIPKKRRYFQPYKVINLEILVKNVKKPWRFSKKPINFSEPLLPHGYIKRALLVSLFQSN